MSPLLDWGSSSHFNFDGPAPCRYCGRPAHLLDSRRPPAKKGHPAHKVCAELAFEVQAAEAAAAYRKEQL